LFSEMSRKEFHRRQIKLSFLMIQIRCWKN